MGGNTATYFTLLISRTKAGGKRGGDKGEGRERGRHKETEKLLLPWGAIQQHTLND